MQIIMHMQLYIIITGAFINRLKRVRGIGNGVVHVHVMLLHILICSGTSKTIRVTPYEQPISNIFAR